MNSSLLTPSRPIRFPIGIIHLSLRPAFLALVLLAQLAPTTASFGATVIGTGLEVTTDWTDPQGQPCDYVSITGAQATIANNAGQNTRIVFMDRDGDLVIVSFKGAGTITVSLEEMTALATPTNHEYVGGFSQQYQCVSGHASLTLLEVDATTSLSIYSIGSTTTNDLIRPKAGASYQGIADIKQVTIIAGKSTDYPIGALSLANARFSGHSGVVGLSSAGVDSPPCYAKPVSVSIYDIEASGMAVPVLKFASGTEVAICGGDLLQPNAMGVLLNPGMTLKYQAGLTSGGTVLPTVPCSLAVTSQPEDLTVAAEGKALFSAADNRDNARYQWRHNGRDLAEATNSILTIESANSASAGLYSAKITVGGDGTTTQEAILGLTIPGKLADATEEVGANITHQNGRTFDQMLLQGTSAALRADAGQITRLSYIDLTDDIVQVEFSGAGTLTLTLEPGSSGPAAPVNYNQSVAYMRGHARIVVAGADETTNLSVFSVGRLTAWDPTGAFDFLQASSTTNDPAKNGSPLFKGTVTYDGFADLASISILSASGKFGGLRTSNASYYATSGLTGVYAPGITFTGPVFVGDINASDSAEPVLRLGSASDVRITGGDLAQLNSRAVSVSGFTRLRFSAGQTSHGALLSPQTNKANLTSTDATSIEIVKDGN